VKRLHRNKSSIMVCLAITTLILAGVLFPAVSSNPVIAQGSQYSTYIGGTMGEDATKVTFDNEGNTILIGQTASEDFPVTDNAIQSEYGGGGWDAYVAKFSPSGDLLYSTYLGGNQYEHVTTVNVDSQNNIILAGTTGSTGFHTTPDALQLTLGGLLDGFLMKLAPNGTLLYSSFFGGAGNDWIYGLQFDASGNWMFSGHTGSDGLATSGVIGETKSAGTDAFIARVSAGGSTKQMFSYIGGDGTDRATMLKIDSDYNYVISGFTDSSDYPVTGNAFQSTATNRGDAILTKISYSGASLVYSTMVGGNDDELAVSVAIDSDDNMIITGYSESDDLAVVNAYQPDFGGGTADIFIAKVNKTGSMQFLTYLGGSETDYAWEVAVDSDDNIIVGGRSASPDYPTMNGLNDTYSGSFDAVATKLTPDGQTILVSSYIGGSGSDIGEGLAVDDDDNIVVTGRTVSDDFPITTGAYQETIGSSSDSFVCHIAFSGFPSTTITSNTTTTTTTTTTTSEDGLQLDTTTLLLIGVGGAAVVIVIVIVLKRK